MRFALILLFVAAANAAQLRRVSEPIPGQYIVKIKPGSSVYSALRSVGFAGGRVLSVYDSVLNGFAAELSDKALDTLLNLPSVEYVEENGIIRAMSVASWGLDRIDQRDLPLNNTYNAPGTGTGVTVYVIDTGILSTHIDFGGRVVSSIDCTGLNAEACQGDGNDGHGHGTHCAGTVGGTLYGVAKNVSLVGVKVLRDSGLGSNAGIIRGIDWVKGDAVGKLAVASMSLGGGASTALDEAIHALNASGVPTVVAAGNDNADACNSSPARAPDAVTVGSTTSTDERSSFSNYGSCLDIFAPGTSITSAWIGSNNATVTISGTSMATPHVAGALALIRAAHPDDSAEHVIEELLHHATPGKVTNAGAGSPDLLLFVDDDHDHDDHDH